MNAAGPLVYVFCGFKCPLGAVYGAFVTLM